MLTVVCCLTAVSKLLCRQTRSLKDLTEFTKAVEGDILHCFTMNAIHRLYVAGVNKLPAS